MSYSEDNMLMLSGIQHFVFCPRQWALIHLEQLWAENRFTAEGQILHKNVDDPTKRVLNNDTITLRSVNIASKRLGLYGVTDVVELLPVNYEYNSITHKHYSGRFILYPVEYKRGRSKITDCDIMQLVAQVICLEEMYNVEIRRAALFYWEVRRREEIDITDKLRRAVEYYAKEMHEIFDGEIIPLARKEAKCKNCSLIEICRPDINGNVNNYLKKMLE